MIQKQALLPLLFLGFGMMPTHQTALPAYEAPTRGMASYSITMQIDEEWEQLPAFLQEKVPREFEAEVVMQYSPTEIVSNGAALAHAVMNAVLERPIVNDDMQILYDRESGASKVTLQTAAETYFMETEFEACPEFEPPVAVGKYKGRQIFRSRFTHEDEVYSILYVPEIKVPFISLPVALPDCGLVIELESDHFQVRLKELAPASEQLYQLPADAVRLEKKKFKRELERAMRAGLTAE